jgi:geranylgeranyl pyrophosphate synthase
VTGASPGDEELIAELWPVVRPNQLRLASELVADVALLQDDIEDHEAWRRIRFGAHRLAGTLGTYLQQPAGDLAVALDRLVAGVEQPSEELQRRVAPLAAALHEAMLPEAGGQVEL